MQAKSTHAGVRRTFLNGSFPSERTPRLAETTFRIRCDAYHPLAGLAALQSLHEWTAQYRKIARVALREESQLLEKIGIVVRTSSRASSNEDG